MELIKDLPEVFEEFAEQRQKSFLAVKELKEKGVPVVGSYCTYFPKEIAMAMGAGCVSLCSTSDETIPEAEKDLPKNLCPLIKSSYGFAKTDKCQFFYFSTGTSALERRDHPFQGISGTEIWRDDHGRADP